MLLMFKVRNYTSFKDTTVLDLRATSLVQHTSHCICVNEKTRLLKVNAILGKNASGKSNFVSAMYFLKRFIFSQFVSDKESADLDDMDAEKIKLEPFLLSDVLDEASEFEIIFFSNGKQIQYGFECTSREVLSEWFLINDKTVFERKGFNVELGTAYRKVLADHKKTAEGRLHIAILEWGLDEKTKSEVLGDFLNYFSKEYNVFMEVLFESSVKGIAGSFGILTRLLNDEVYRGKVAEYLIRIDLGIKGIDVQEEVTVNKKTGKEQKRKVLKTIHEVYNSAGKKVKYEYFDLIQESSGTLRFLSYIQHILKTIENGGVFIVDEISARLHPKLTKLIVDIFQSDINSKAQLIFTTHDISLLNNNQFRRDEVVFIDKNNHGESSLYTLSDLRVREDATFHKDYMQGKYGAIPILNYDDLLGGII